MESAYEQCLVREFSLADITFEIQKPIPIAYKGVQLDGGYRLDLLVENKIILEIKSIDKLLPIHEAQILTYMKFAHMPVGLLINFNVNKLINGLKRYRI